MNDSSRALVQDELDAVGDVLHGRSGGSGLSRLLSVVDHVGTLAAALFRTSTVLKRAVLANLLARLKRAPVSGTDLRSAERVVAAIDVLERSSNAAVPAAGLGQYAADFIVGAVLRGDRAPEHELEALFAGHPANVRATLEAARAACILDDVLLTFVAMRERGRSVKLGDIFAAMATVIDAEIKARSGQACP